MKWARPAVARESERERAKGKRDELDNDWTISGPIRDARYVSCCLLTFVLCSIFHCDQLIAAGRKTEKTLATLMCAAPQTEFVIQIRLGRSARTGNHE